ncbi:type II secretion system F family protein [Noviherbaspirillum agri]
MDYFYYGFIVLGFFAIVGLIEGVYLTWNAYRGPEATRIKRRLQAMSAAGTTVETKLLKKRLLSEVPLLERILLQLPRVQHLDRLLIQSGTGMTVAGFHAVALSCVAITIVIAYIAAMPVWLGVVMGIGASLLPFAYLFKLRDKRLNSIETQLPDALDLMARALRAGHAFSSALSMVGQEGPEPIAQEFRTTFDEINFGVPVQKALTNLATRVASTDLRYFVVAVLIQRETGGNLAELMENIAMLIRERLKLAATVRVLSAEGRLSAWILGILPFAVGGLINVVNPKFLSLLWTDPTGLNVVAGALALMVVGVIWMWRVITIRV